MVCIMFYTVMSLVSFDLNRIHNEITKSQSHFHDDLDIAYGMNMKVCITHNKVVVTLLNSI